MSRFAPAACCWTATGCGGPPRPMPLKPVRFLSINDVYVADTLADGQGGLARVATVRNRWPTRGRFSSCSRAMSSARAAQQV